MVEHESVAVGILEERHVADARVEGLAEELDALRLELGARRGDVVDVQRDVRVLLRRELHPERGRLVDPEARLADPELALAGGVGPQPERVDVEGPRSRPVGGRHGDEVEARHRASQPRDWLGGLLSVVGCSWPSRSD